MMTKTSTEETTAVPTSIAPTLLLAFELGDRTWKLGFTIGFGQSARMCSVPARATDRVLEEIARAKVRFHLPANVSVISCYEAGREGLWLHRWLLAPGGRNHVIDSSSIEVNRRARCAKTDRLDLGGLLTLLARHVHGDRVWRVVRAPSVAEEDARHLHRTRETLQQDRTRLINRLKSLLLTQGLALAGDASFPTALRTAQWWDGTAIPAGLKARLDRAGAHLTFLNDELEQLDAERDAISVDSGDAAGPLYPRLAHAAWDWSGRRVDVGHGTVWVAGDPESAPIGRLGRIGAVAVSRHHARRASACAAPDRAARLGLGAVSAGLSVAHVVSTSVWRRRAAAPTDRDRGAGAHTAHCLVAVCRTRRTPRRSPSEAGDVVVRRCVPRARRRVTTELVRVSDDSMGSPPGPNRESGDPLPGFMHTVSGVR
jgi:hypothetical protein